MNKTTIDYVEDLEKSINKLVTYSVGLELEATTLRKVIRILAESFALNEDGETVKTLTKEQVEYVKQVCEKYNVFS